MSQGRAIPRLFWASLPTVREPFPVLLGLQHTANTTVPSLPVRKVAVRDGDQEPGPMRRAQKEWEWGWPHLPQARDACEAVPSLCVPHTHTASQAATHKQHAIAGQALNVL